MNFSVILDTFTFMLYKHSNSVGNSSKERNQPDEQNKFLQDDEDEHVRHDDVHVFCRTCLSSHLINTISHRRAQQSSGFLL